MNKLMLAGSVLALTACGPQLEEDLITDQEVAAVQTSESALTVAPPPSSSPAAFHLRLTWGLLAGELRAPDWIDWTGGVKVDSGTAGLEHLIFFDRHDLLQPSPDPTLVKWSSRTRPHFDGVVVRVQPGAAGDVVHLRTAAFSKDFPAAALAAGLDQRFTIDTAGHQLSVSAIPAAGCGGFAYGYEKPAPAGWLGFAGLLTNESGHPQGVLRFRADGNTIHARLLGKGQAVLAQGEGRLNGTKFELSLGSLGTVAGFYEGPSYSPRGSFQAVLTCHQSAP